MLLARQVMFIGSRSPVRDAVHDRLQQLGVRSFEEHDMTRAAALLSTTKRLALLIADNRDGRLDLKALPAVADIPVLVLTGTSGAPATLREVEGALTSAIFPPPLIDAVSDATRESFAQQLGLSLTGRGVRLRGDAVLLGEAAAAIVFNSTTVVGYLGVFAPAGVIEDRQRVRYGVDSKASDIALELANLIGGRLRTTMLGHIADFVCRLPHAWHEPTAAKQGAPAAVLSFDHGVSVDLRVSRGDAEVFDNERASEALAEGSVSFLE